MSSIPKIKVVVNKSSEYPTLEGFPRTTEELYLVGLNRKSFDRQILRLQSLRILNLSNNQISSLPNELGTLQHLQQLILSQNRLDKSLKWIWLDQVPIRSNLKLLDISNNSVCVTPVYIIPGIFIISFIYSHFVTRHVFVNTVTKITTTNWKT